VPSGKGSVRAFRRDIEDNIEHRSNELYDKHIHILSQVPVASLQIRKIHFLCSTRENRN